jgi:inner membrane protein involved in colicin E2 resistance
MLTFEHHSEDMVFQGFFWMMVIFNWLVFSVTRQRAFFWFGAYNACMAVVFLYFAGFLLPFCPEHPIFINYALNIAAVAIPGCYGMFVTTLLRGIENGHFIILFLQRIENLMFLFHGAAAGDGIPAALHILPNIKSGLPITAILIN